MIGEKFFEVCWKKFLFECQTDEGTRVAECSLYLRHPPHTPAQQVRTPQDHNKHRKNYTVFWIQQYYKLATLWRPLLPYRYSYKASCARLDWAITRNFWQLGILTLRADRRSAWRQSARMSKIKWRLNPVWHRMLYSCTQYPFGNSGCQRVKSRHSIFFFAARCTRRHGRLPTTSTQQILDTCGPFWSRSRPWHAPVFLITEQKNNYHL